MDNIFKLLIIEMVWKKRISVNSELGILFIENGCKLLVLINWIDQIK